jgi:hypothetical protein
MSIIGLMFIFKSWLEAHYHLIICTSILEIWLHFTGLYFTLLSALILVAAEDPHHKEALINGVFNF